MFKVININLSLKNKIHTVEFISESKVLSITKGENNSVWIHMLVEDVSYTKTLHHPHLKRFTILNKQFELIDNNMKYCGTVAGEGIHDFYHIFIS